MSGKSKWLHVLFVVIITLSLLLTLTLAWAAPVDGYDSTALSYGIYWFGKNNANQKFVSGESNLYFDSAKPTLIFVHGWQPFLSSSLPGFDYAGNDTVAAWIDDGWNVGIFAWNQFSDETDGVVFGGDWFSGGPPEGVTDAEAKVWTHEGPEGMRWRDWSEPVWEDGYKEGPAKCAAQLLYEEYVAAMEGYTGTVRIAGHSLGNQMAVRLTKLVHDGIAASEVPEHLRPTRVALLDPYWSPSPRTYLGGKTTGEVIREYVVELLPTGTLFEWYWSSEWNDGRRQLTLHLNSDDVEVLTLAGLNWAPYQYEDEEWLPYPMEEYWEILEERYESAFSEEYAGEPDPEELRGGAVLVGQTYYLRLYNGISVAVQADDEPLNHNYQTSDRPLWSRISKTGALGVVYMVNQVFVKKFFQSTMALRALWILSQRKKFGGAWKAGSKAWNALKFWVKLLRNRQGYWWRSAVGVTVAMLGIAVLFGVWLYKSYVGDWKGGKVPLAVTIGVIFAVGMILLPVLQTINMVRTFQAAQGLSKWTALNRLFTKRSDIIGATRKAAVIGLIVTVGIIWGVFIYAAVKEGLKPGTLAFSMLLAETIAATILALILFAISLTVIGTLLVNIIMVIDTILYTLGIEWTITRGLTWVITKVIFSYEVAVEPDVDVGGLDMALVTPEEGLISDALLEFGTTITTTVTHANPKDLRTKLYIWHLYDEEQLRGTAFKYSLDSKASTLTAPKYGSRRVDWQDYKYDHTYWGHDMHTAYSTDDVSTGNIKVTAGINRDHTVPLFLNLSFSLPGVECWSIPIPPLYFTMIIVCKDRSAEGATSEDLSTVVTMDVFPKTLDEFWRVHEWAPDILIRDADGDGLIARDYNGNDPNDTKWDSDDDGLSDAWEMQMSAWAADEGGAFFDPLMPDTDEDGLPDGEEARLGTNPNHDDSDGDGITDVDEAENGWAFHYAAGKSIRIYSDPLNPDWDADGMDDLFERTLHTDCEHAEPAKRDQCYRDNAYHPYVWNNNPIGVYTEMEDEDDVVRPGQTFVYTTTVKNQLKTASPLWVRGTTELTPDPLTGNPLDMTYDIPKGEEQSVYSKLTVPGNSGNKKVTLTTDVDSQLHTPSDWGWDGQQSSSHGTASGATPQAVAVTPVDGWTTPYAAAVLENNRVYVYAATADGIAGSGALAIGGAGDVSNAPPDIACNDDGVCLVVWSLNNGGDYFRWRVVQPTAQVAGSITTMTAPDGESTWSGSVASDGSDFLVAWSEGGGSQIKVYNVDANGDTVGSVMVLDSGAVGNVDVDWADNQFRVVWSRDDTLYAANVYGQGASDEAAIASGVDTDSTFRVAHDTLSHQALVVYRGPAGSDCGLCGRVLSGDSVSDEINLGNVDSAAGPLDIGASDDPINGGWIVAWSLLGDDRLHYQAVGMDGGLRGDRETIKLKQDTNGINLACSTPRPSAQLRFDEDSGATTFADSSGYEHDGECTAGACNAGVGGKSGNAVAFDGDDVVTVMMDVSETAYGVTLWFKSTCQNCGLYSVSEGNLGATAHDRHLYLQRGLVCARVGESICTSDDYADGNWHHVAHVFGGSEGGQRLYVDGGLRVSGNATESSLSGQDRVHIGYSNDAQDTYLKDGSIDEVTIYPRALSEGEIGDNYRAALIVFPFDETEGASNFSNAAHNGYTGSCEGNKCPKAGKQGQSHSAVYFKSDLVTVAAEPHVPLANSPFTVAFWAKRDRSTLSYSYVCGRRSIEHVLSQGNGGEALFAGFQRKYFVCGLGDEPDRRISGLEETGKDWHHYACTYDGNEMILYQDGEEDYTRNVGSYNGTGLLELGEPPSSWESNCNWKYVGLLDELAVWDQQLSAGEIRTLYEKVKVLDDSMTECALPRAGQGSANLFVHRLALRETTTTLGKSEQQVEDEITVDADKPSTAITSLEDDQYVRGVGTLAIEGEAEDNTFVAEIDLCVDGASDAQCELAEGTEIWAYDLDLGALSEGSHELYGRATDAGGNVKTSSGFTIHVDRTAPQITQANTPRRAVRDAQDRWVAPLDGTVSDALAGVKSAEAFLKGQGGAGWQFATLDNDDWSLDYFLPVLDNEGNDIANPTGVYTLNLRAEDQVGNRLLAGVNDVFELDNTAPEVGLTYPLTDTPLLTDTTESLTGVITDSGEITSGVSDVQVAFVLADEKDAPWHDAVLDQSGEGVFTSTWALLLPEGLEGFYEIRLRGVDVLGNEQSGIKASWRGMIDTRAPRVYPDRWAKVAVYGPTTVTCDVRDLSLEENTVVCPCPKSFWEYITYDQVSAWYRETTTDTTRLYQIYASCTYPSAVATVLNSACDTFGRCTTGTDPELPTLTPTPTPTPTPTGPPPATPTPTPIPTPTPEPEELPLYSAVYTPTHGEVFSTTDAFDVEGPAYAEDYLKTLTVTVNGGPFYNTGWLLVDQITETMWSASFAPTPFTESPYTFCPNVDDWDGRVQTTTYPITVTVDLLPPAPPTFDTAIITTAHRANQGVAIITGVASDTVGVERVDVNPDGEGWSRASLSPSPLGGGQGWGWRYLWRIGDEDPDGENYNVTARATDFTSRTNETNTSLHFDMRPPDPVTLTLSYFDDDFVATRHPVEPLQIITDGHRLVVEWTPSTDGNGVAGYVAGWTTSTASTEGLPFVPHGTVYSVTQVISEGVTVYAHADPVDVLGNQRQQFAGPVYVDTPYTPDVTDLNYHGWMESGCTQLGVDRRVSERAPTGASLNEEQKLYATWDEDALRLAWTGANWNVEGDLFVYLDTAPDGGATQLYNPYGLGGAEIYLPGNMPSVDTSQWPIYEKLRQTQGISPLLDLVMQAEYVIWVEDSYSATLAVNPIAGVAPPQDFVLAWPYRWPNLGPGACPYWQTWPEPPTTPTPRFIDIDLRAELTVEPVGTTFAMFDDDLFWQWETLFLSPGVKSELFTFLDHDHPPLGQGNVVTYRLRIANRGTDTAEDVQAFVSAYNALRLHGGTKEPATYREYRILKIGPIAPNTVVTYPFTGWVETEANWRYNRCMSGDVITETVCRRLLEWAMLDALIFDARSVLSLTRGITPTVPMQPPLEWVWSDHAVDIAPPEIVGIDPALAVVRPATNTIRGYAVDPSGVPLVEMEVVDSLGITITLTCPDDTPDDGNWACDWFVDGDEGDTFDLRARATDGFGHISDWTAPWRTVVVDSTPPTFTLDAEVRVAVEGQLIGPSGFLLTGVISDNHSPGAIDVCREIDGEMVCDVGTALVATQSPVGMAYVYEDVPGAPIPINSTTNSAVDVPIICLGGEVTRVFTVTDEFIAGDVDLGFNAEHPNRDELVVELVSPAGTHALAIGPGNVISGFQNYDVWLDDASSQSLHIPVDDDTEPPYYDREARPDGVLSVFNGEPVSGTWELRICDLLPGMNDGMYRRARLSLRPQDGTLPTAGPWSYPLPLPTGADGLEQTLFIYGIDGLGNRSTISISLSYLLDVVPPELTVTDAVSRLLELSPSPVLTGQVSDGGGLDDVYVRVSPPDGPFYHELVSRDGKDWDYTLQPDEAGTYTLWLEAYDLVGNVTQLGPYTVVAGSETEAGDVIPVGGYTEPISLPVLWRLRR